MLDFKAFLVFACAGSSWAAVVRSALPIVDLGYVLQQATINETGQYYNFSNIRYGAAPVGNLRFAAPVPPTTINRTVNDGQTANICPQAGPYWYQIMTSYLSGVDITTLGFIAAQVNAAADALTIASVPEPDPRETEDCLFLDVMTPVDAFNGGKKLPVLVWIYGGGFTTGSKTSAGNPASLIAKAKEDAGEGVVFVAINYRLGLFGWLPGSTFAGQGGLPNAGLYDQRLALEWIAANIGRFGGDSSRVTVLGESAGGASIMHQITAFGGAKAPFQKAIMQSPGFSVTPADAQQEAVYNTVLSDAQSLISTNITDVSALRALDSKTIAALNYIVIARSEYSSFTFGPVVDGTFAPKLPGVLLEEGKFDSSVEVMTAHNSNEGIVFTSPFLDTEDEFKAALENQLSTATTDAIDYITNTLYPAVYNGSYPYTNVNQRATLFAAELSFTCNTRYLNTAFSNETSSYYFAVPPGLHGQDIAYTFFNGDTTTLNDGSPVNAATANLLQKYIANFATSESADPNGPGLPYFPVYGNNATVLVLDLAAQGQLAVDSAANGRCAWLQKALYA
ncbi:hypothetical protein HYALB_00002403 [Hymenoscyphus albidus]|uniref:Carboxylic ester hydrolase n=1 Tax=Hymenoscyphus albidus TaxID=595503 RepID=A0A9N9LN45_9HELO|nr:hypothetical protein HYALB_00002403 [Hymenoscyphus albidus]